MTKKEDQSEALNKIIRHNVLWSMGSGLVPVPMLDVAIVSGVQLKMLSEISKHFDVKFEENMGKGMITSLIGGVASESIARGTFGSIIKTIPVIGTLAGALVMPAVAGASTYAVARVFIQHFESGGTFFDFKVEDFKKVFKEQVKEGKDYVAGIAKNINPKKGKSKK